MIFFWLKKNTSERKGYNTFERYYWLNWKKHGPLDLYFIFFYRTIPSKNSFKIIITNGLVSFFKEKIFLNKLTPWIWKTYPVPAFAEHELWRQNWVIKKLDGTACATWVATFHVFGNTLWNLTEYQTKKNIKLSLWIFYHIS